MVEAEVVRGFDDVEGRRSSPVSSVHRKDLRGGEKRAQRNYANEIIGRPPPRTRTDPDRPTHPDRPGPTDRPSVELIEFEKPKREYMLTGKNGGLFIFTPGDEVEDYSSWK